jgi:hypothetical protein
LGTYLRRRQEDETPLPAPALPKRASSPPAPVADREVRVVVNWLLSQAFEQTGIRVADDKLAYERIVEAAHKAVKSLKTQPVVDVSLPFLTADASGPKHLEARLTREMINELVKY